MLFLFSVLYAADSGDAWAARTENATVRLRASADQLAGVAEAVGASGRVSHLAVLSSDAAEVKKRADQLVTWASQGPSTVPPPTNPPTR